MKDDQSFSDIKEKVKQQESLARRIDNLNDQISRIKKVKQPSVSFDDYQRLYYYDDPSTIEFIRTVVVARLESTRNKLMKNLKELIKY